MTQQLVEVRGSSDSGEGVQVDGALTDVRAEGNVLPFTARRVAAAQPMSQPTDADLLERCRQHDGDAWNQLVTRYERLVYTVALRNGLSVEDAADVTQTTFVQLLDSLDKLRDEDRLSSWLMTVARRQSWRIRNRVRSTVPLEHAEETSVDPFSDWDTAVTLHGALETLGGTCRTLLTALYFEAEEPSYAEIAARLGRSIGGIGPLRGRCLDKLRTILEGA